MFFRDDFFDPSARKFYEFSAPRKQSFRWLFSLKKGGCEIWLAMHGWKIRKLEVELDGKPLAELIRLDEKLIVVINKEEKKMRVINDVEIDKI